MNKIELEDNIQEVILKLWKTSMKKKVKKKINSNSCCLTKKITLRPSWVSTKLLSGGLGKTIRLLHSPNPEDLYIY